MTEKKLNYILISSLIAIIILYIANCFVIINSSENNRFQNSYNAACAVKDRNMEIIGSGCLLDNGLVITAAHVIDTNDDDIIEADEKILNVEFGTGLITTAIVVQFGLPNFVRMDYALLEITERPKCNGLRITEEVPKLGDNLYLISCPDGQELQLTSGLYTGRGNHDSICSVPIFPGSSGGAIFNEKQEIVGIVSRIGNSLVSRTLIFAADGPVLIDGTNYITYQNWYCSSTSLSLDMPKNLPEWQFQNTYLIFSLLVMIYVWFKRKTLLV